MGEQEKEKEYLRKTLDVVRCTIDEVSSKTSQSLEEIRKFNRYVWEQKKDMDKIEMVSSITDTETLSDLTNTSIKNLRNLRQALSSPYFGRITFMPEKSSSPIDVYIGKNTIMENRKILVFDWRTPIASLFYNGQMGATSYKAPIGDINGVLSSRRQYKIEDGNLIRFIETGIHLDDDALQEALSQESSDKMRNIVSSIQQEQNQVIRNTKDKNIIVQGCAGSGKSAVALHRLAYLLYQDKLSTSNNMLVFSPNEAFSQYISNVLPEIGEENVQITTFNEFVGAYIKDFTHIETLSEFLSRSYSNKISEENKETLNFKFSDEYKDALDEFISRISKEFSIKNNIKIREYEVNKNALNKRLNLYKDLPLPEQLEELTKDICKSLRLQYNDVEFTIKKRLIKELNPTLNFSRLYREFLASNEYISRCPNGKREIIKDNKFLEYPDSIGMLYMALELLGYPHKNVIRHLVIDEIQDYSKLQVEMIKKMFSGASFTMLGDINQTINPYFRYETLEELLPILGRDTKYFELNRAYRTTPEITEYTNMIINNEENNSVRNSNNIPVVFREVQKQELPNQLVSDILTMQENGLKRIAIITKEEEAAKALYDALKDDIEGITVISENGNEFNSNAVILPSYVSKGLEFDGVISYTPNDSRYDEEDKYLYYVACTRAQHNLVVYNEPGYVKRKRKND